MPRRPSFLVSSPAEGTFLVHVPASLSMLGKLERRTFKDSKTAEAFAAKLRTQYHKGARGGIVDPGTAHALTAAEKALRDAGLNVSLIEAVRAYADARVILDPLGTSIGEVVKSYHAAYKARGDDRTFADAAAAFVTEKEIQWSDRYARNIEQTRKALPQWFLDLKLPEITAELMLKAVREKVTTPTAIETRMRHVKSLCSGKGKKRQKRSVTLMTADQCDAMLEACQSPEETRVVALLLFAGIRPDKEHGEITKLDWEDIKGGKIYVSSDMSKTNTERIIPIRPRLAGLIKGHPKSGSVIPAGWQKRIQQIRKAAGMNDPRFQDATRHAFASHHLVAYGEAATQAAMGHTEGSRTLFKHYRTAVTLADAKRYFKAEK